ncbi:MAG: hypothetical protein JO053_06405 [Acidobacteria bacterium]|nr:hypothetical protein [Acidobacteriota bacterium]
MPVVEAALRKELVVPVEDNAVGSAGVELRHKMEIEVGRLLDSEFRWTNARFAMAREALSDLSILGTNWDSYGGAAPSHRSVQNASRILDLLQSLDFAPARVLPSAEGGVGVCFVSRERYADIECSNDGEILGVYYVGMQMPRLLEVDGTDESITAALERIREHITR